MKKIVTIILALSLVLGLALSVSAAAAEETKAIAAAEGTMGDKSISWTGTNFKMVNEQDASSSAIRNSDADHFRAYKGSKTTITALNGEKLSKLTITTTGGKYLTGLQDSLTGAEGVTVTTEGDVVTLTFTTPVESFAISATGGQWRLSQIVVAYAGGTAAEPETPADPAAGTELSVKDAIALGASKEHNNYTADKYYVSGEITEVYNTQYGNMKIKDAEGNILTIYGTYSADGSTRYDALEVKPVAGDTVKVYGIIGQYNGTAQVKNGWIVEHTPAAGGEEPEKPETPADPAPDTKLSVKDAIALGASKDHNTYTTGKYYVTGEITEIYNTQYGNMKIKDAEGNILTIYGTYSADGKDRFDAMTKQPAVGDTITVYGIIGQYNGTAQVKNGWIVEEGPAETADPSIIALAAMMLPVSGIGLGALCLKRKKEN